MNVYLRVHNFRRHGIDMAAGILFDAHTGRPVTSVVRWSEMQARRDAHAWAAIRNIRVSDEPTQPKPQSGVAPAASLPEERHG